MTVGSDMNCEERQELLGETEVGSEGAEQF